MCKANLLVCLESFYWEDLTINRSRELEDLSIALTEISTIPDTVFGHPNGYDFLIERMGFFHDILYFDDEERNIYTDGWFTHDHQKLLISIWKRTPTPLMASTLHDLNAEFGGENNGLLGVNTVLPRDYYVYDKISWEALHHDFVGNNPRLKNLCLDYFLRFYITRLTQPANQINTLISRGQVHGIFKRLDTPTVVENGQTLHDEKIQIHFNDNKNSALNIDGTWKHGKCDIPKEARDQLEDWGFLLPD